MQSSASKRGRLQIGQPCKNTKDVIVSACNCSFHTSSRNVEIDPTVIPEAQKWARRKTLMGSKSSVGLNRIDTLESSKLAGETVRGEVKLLKFLALLDFICYKTPYAASHFNVNQSVLKKLVINHLPLIVGKEDAAANSQRLIAIVSGKQEKPASLIWVTNRQQVSIFSVGARAKRGFYFPRGARSGVFILKPRGARGFLTFFCF